MSSETLRGRTLGQLSTLSRAIAHGSDPHDILRLAAEQAMTTLDAKGAVVALDAGHRIDVAATAGYAPETFWSFGQLTLDSPYPLTHALRTGTSVWLGCRDEAHESFPALLGAPTTSHAWAAVPLVANGRPFGAIGVTFSRSQTFTDDDRSHFELLADITSTAFTVRAPDRAVATPAATSPTGPDPELYESITGRMFLASSIIENVRRLSELVEYDRAQLGDAVHQIEAAMSELDQARLAPVPDEPAPDSRIDLRPTRTSDPTT